MHVIIILHSSEGGGESKEAPGTVRKINKNLKEIPKIYEEKGLYGLQRGC